MVPEKTREDIIHDMELGEREEDIYSDEGREELMEEEDEITDIDEGFMKGYEEGEKIAECQNCGAILLDEVVERIIDDETYRFCSSKCASEFEKKPSKG